MKTQQAIEYARKIKSKGVGKFSPVAYHAIVALLDHGDKVQCPDLVTSVRMVAANMHAQGKFYVEIAVDPKTKEVGWTFEPTNRDETHKN